MQESFEVSAASGSYRVIVGYDLLKRVIIENPDAIFLVDDYFESLSSIPVGRRILVNASENNKALEYMAEVILKLRELGANRSTHLVVLGGGVIQDIATFSASIYMRGIQWTYMPSTLLSMADSCIGGKSSINVLGYKNLVGNFYPPKEVLVDVDFVDSMDSEKIVGGLFEAAKICYARGFEDFQAHLSDAPDAQTSKANILAIIVRALKTKKWFIEIDEFDQKERLLLNFGHTFGHAIEAGTNFGVSHGIAVGIGMMVAVEFAQKRGWLSTTGLNRTASLISHIHDLISFDNATLTASSPVINLNLIVAKFKNDKKHLTNKFRIICPRGDGELELIAEDRNEKVIADIVFAYEVALRSIAWKVAPVDGGNLI
jgi:3-dehydroquinate synthase